MLRRWLMLREDISLLVLMKKTRSQKDLLTSLIERKAESIYNTCHQHILPRIAKLEAKLHELRLQDKEYNLVIIHIPFSENRPHGFNSNGTLNFVKRYGDTTKEFQIEEFIPDLLARHHLPSMDNIRGS